MNKTKARRTALYGIILTLIFVGAMILLYFNFVNLLKEYRETETVAEGFGALIGLGIGLGMIVFMGVILFIIRLIFLIKSIINAGKISQKTSSTLILVGIIIPLVDVVGLCMLRKALKA